MTQSWDRMEVVCEDAFDSYSINLNTFKAQLSARLLEFSDNEEGYVYYIASDAWNYYQVTDATKLQGHESVTISVTCSDGATLGQGLTQYKCRKCDSSLDAHSREYVVQASVTENELDLSELDILIRGVNNQVAVLRSQVSALEKENANLLKKIAEASVEDAAAYRQQYNSNRTRIEELRNELTERQQKQKEYADAEQEAETESDVPTGDYYRLPVITQDCKTAYNLIQQDGGTWSGYTPVRKTTMSNINGITTFCATISIVRKSEYFLGIKIHRTITQISWELTSVYIDTHVVDVLTLDPNLSNEGRTKTMNNHILEIAREYPNCKITTEYARIEFMEEIPNSDVYHLLWSSGCLEIVREMGSYIAKVYVDLVSLEKMIHYKWNTIDVLRDVPPKFNTGEGRRLTLVKECHDRWIENARTP